MEPGTGNRGSEQPGFKQLNAWVAADELASLAFRTVQKLPTEHRWLGIQMARAAVSVPANIAEGYGRGSLADYLRFLDIARGSLGEVEYYIHFLGQQELVPRDQVEALEQVRDDTGRLLHGLWASLKRKTAPEWNHSGPAIRETRAEYEVEHLN